MTLSLYPAKQDAMAALVLRSILPEFHERLKRRAEQNRRSMTKEAVAILERKAVRSSDDVNGSLHSSFSCTLGDPSATGQSGRCRRTRGIRSE